MLMKSLFTLSGPQFQHIKFMILHTNAISSHSKPTTASSDASTLLVMTHPRPIHTSTNTTQSPQDKGDMLQLHPKHPCHHGHKKCWSKHVSKHMAGILPSHIPLPSFANTFSFSTTLMSGIGLNIFVTPSLAKYKSGMIHQTLQ